MSSRFVIPPLRRPRARTTFAALIAPACAGLLAPVAVGQTLAGGQTAQQPSPSAGASVAALEECVTTGSQEERAATFSSEMSAVPGTVRMAIRIDLLERAGAEEGFHEVGVSAHGAWRPSDPKVKVYKYVREFSNLSMPAAYRARVRFRWIGAKGHTLKRAERLTGRCVQPAEVPGASTAPGTPAGPGATTPGA